MRERFRRLLLAATACFALSGAFLAPDHVRAQEIDKDKIVVCMLEKTTEQDIAAMRSFMVAALTDDQDGMKRQMLQVGFAISNLAMNTCHMDYALLSKPEFADIARIYGQKLGEKIMTDAFAKLK